VSGDMTAAGPPAGCTTGQRKVHVRHEAQFHIPR
jgi:hypothetical protein